MSTIQHQHLQRFTGKVVLVTGAGNGIGRAIALEFVREGASLVLSGRVESKLIETVKQIKEQFDGKAKAVYQVGDIASEEVNNQLVETALKEYGRLDIVINNAAVYHLKKFFELDNGRNFMIDINIKGLIYGIKHQLSAIGKTSTPDSQGVIININSVAGISPVGNTNVYAAAKAFIDSFTTSMAVEGAEYNVRVNAINPDLTIAEGAVNAFGTNPDGLVSFYEQIGFAKNQPRCPSIRLSSCCSSKTSINIKIHISD